MKLIYYTLLLGLGAVSCSKELADKPTTNLPTQDTEWVVYNKTNSLLPNNQVNAIAIDKNDVTWIGTANGLCRINNTTWTIFNSNNSELPSPFIRTIAVEENGNVWVGTDKGLTHFDGNNWKTYKTANSAITTNSVLCITHHAGSKTTWIATEKELIRIDRNNNWHRFDEIEGDIILSMTTDNAGALWLGTFDHFAFRGRIKKFDGSQWTTFQLDQLGYPSAFPNGVVVDKQNTVWTVLSGTSVKSILRFQNGSWQEVTGPTTATGFRCIVADEDKIWTGGNTLALTSNEQTTTISLPNKSSGVLAIAVDSKRRKWLGTLNSGVAVYK